MRILVYLWMVQHAIHYTGLQQKTCDSAGNFSELCSYIWNRQCCGEQLDTCMVLSYSLSYFRLGVLDEVLQPTKHAKWIFENLMKNVDGSFRIRAVSNSLLTKMVIKLVIVLLLLYGSLAVGSTKLLKDIKWQNNLHPSLNFTFQYTVPISSKTWIYHFSMKNYFTEVARNSASQLMNYEWARYESFKTFPEYCIVSPLRLAQFGFYYAGKGVEAICFKCGLRNAEWSEEETVAETHKRLAPNCKFINGEETDNVPIHGNETHNEQNTNGACGGPSDITTTNTNTNAKVQRPTTQSGNKQNNEQYSEQTSSSTPERLNERAPNVESSFQAHNYTGQYSDYNPTEEIERFPGITHTRPKHPDYAIKTVRVSSFAHWPYADTMNLDDLANAGFFCVGTQDCVRCFFCGVGMKNWEYGDSPWIEHARWFPECAYVKQCKGEDFVNMCRLSHTDLQTQNNFELDTHGTNVTEDQCIKDLNSIAAKRVLDMGFYQPDVETAIKHARQQLRSTEELKAQHLLQYLLDNSYTRNTDVATRVATSASENNTPVAVNRQQTVLSSTSPSVHAHNNINVPPDMSSSEMITENTSSERKRTSPKDEKSMLKKENQQLKERMMCKVCMDKDANIVFLPCGHLVSCVECAHALRKCAVCRTVIQGTVRAYPA